MELEDEVRRDQRAPGRSYA